MKQLINKQSIAEAIGTFFLVFCGTGAIIINEQSNGAISHAGIAITFGLVVTILIYALGPVSGAHLNPAVSIGQYLRKLISLKTLSVYIIAQCTGALLASFLLGLLFPENQMLGTTMPSGSITQSFVFEFILTFLLMLVIIRVTLPGKEPGQLAGLIIGSTVLSEAMFAGPVSGASMNPARSVGPAIISGHTEHLWIYLTATVAGAATAVLIQKYFNQ